jgi:hypothetical protein
MNGLKAFIQMSNDWLSIVGCGSSKNINSEMLAHPFQKFKTMRPDVELKLVAINFQKDVCFFIIKDGVNKSLIEIEDKELLVCV